MAYANLTATKDTCRQDGEILSLKMDAVKIYKGSLVTMDATDGYATWGNTSTGCQAERPFLGVAAETVDNSAGSAGDKSIKVEISGVHSFVAAAADQTWAGIEVYLDVASDPRTVSSSSANYAPKVGRVVEVVSATEVRVRIDGYAFNVDTAASGL